MKKLYLVRHAEPNYPGGVKHCFGGGTDADLSALGVMQLKDIGEYFSDIELTRVYSSPMLRSRRTAEAVSGGRYPVEIVPGMREIFNGRWEGLSFDRIKELYPEEYALRRQDPFEHTPIGAENWNDARTRGLNAIMPIINGAEGDIALAAHAGMNSLLIRYFSGDYDTHIFDMPQYFACVNTLDITDPNNVRVIEVGKVVVRTEINGSRPV